MIVNKQAVKVMEVNEERLDDGLEIRNSIFSPITKKQWYEGGPSTGSIAYIGEQAVGFIPLLYRDILIDSERTIRTVYENAVGTVTAARGQGVGSKMMEGATQFLQGKADVMMVYRGGERSQGYRFYEKTGHVDVQYIRTHIARVTNNVKMEEDVTVEERVPFICAAEKPLVKLFEQTYAGFAGFPKRHERYWETIMRKHYFAARPHIRFVLFQLMEQGEPSAYGLFCIETRNEEPQLRMLEIASAEGDVARMRKVITSAFAYGAEHEVSGVFVLTGDDDPFLPLLQSMGFGSERRGMMHMTQCFDPKGLMDKFWSEKLHIPGIQLSVHTPNCEFIVGNEEDQEYKKRVTLEMKDHTMAQWLLGRVDFESRVREGTITIHNGNSRIVNWIHQAIPLQKWQYHHLDYC